LAHEGDQQRHTACVDDPLHQLDVLHLGNYHTQTDDCAVFCFDIFVG
jgi:hypothetical protein